MDQGIQRLYLAGPMAGCDDHNFPLFNRAAKHLRAQGFDVFNPAENDDGGTRQPRAFYMRLDIPALMASDAVAVLPGWQLSRGANLEVWLALDLDLPIYSLAEVNGGWVSAPFEPVGPLSLPFAEESIGRTDLHAAPPTPKD